MKQTHVLPNTYTIVTFTKETLVNIYPGKVAVKGKQHYIITFVQDGKQALVPGANEAAKGIVQELLKDKVLKNGALNKIAEARFIKKHPVPKGYQDVEQIYNY